MGTTHRIDWVDALRGACAAVVAFHHARTLFGGLDVALGALSPLCLEAARALSRRNTEAVLIFFVLSGFSIRLSVEGRELGTRAGLGEYYTRRARRILPLYWLSLVLAGLVALGVAPLPERWLSPNTLLGNLLFLQTAVGVPGAWVLPWAANGPLWSLSFEAFFYAAYPWLVRAASGARARWALVVAVSALGHVGNATAPSPFSMFCAASILWYLGADLAERWLGRLPRASWLWPLGLCLMSAALRFGPAQGGLAFHGLWVASAVCTLASAALAFSPRRGAGSVGAPAGRHGAGRSVWRALVWLGTVSYGLYLLHVPVFRAVVALWGPGPAPAFAALVASLGVALVAERWAGRFRAPSRGA